MTDKQRVSRAVSLLLGAIGLVSVPGQAATWHSVAGAQSADKGKQAWAFLANEYWIHVHDSITWTFGTTEGHTVTFLKPGPPAQIRPPFPVGCPGITPNGGPFTGTDCVNSGPLTEGATYTVSFPVGGNFKLTCLVHPRMTGAIHVLDALAPLPHDQSFYDKEAEFQKTQFLADAAALESHGGAGDVDGLGRLEVIAGNASIGSTGGGSSTAVLARFLGSSITVHVGDTVEWINPGPTIVHTVTFGTEPADLVPPSPISIPIDADGVRHAVISSASESVNSGFIGTPNQETVGIPQWPLESTRFRVTFTAPGTFNYICGLHDDLGMVGKVVVTR